MKRPLLWILAAYITGCLCRFYGGASGVFVFTGAVLTFYLCFFLFVFGRFRPVLLLILFLVFLSGAASVQRRLTPEADALWKDKFQARLWGTIERVERKAKSQAVFLKDTRICPASGQRRYAGGRVLLSVSKEQEFFPGCRLVADGMVYQLQEPGNFGQFNEKLYYQGAGVRYKATVQHCQMTGGRPYIVQQFLCRLRGRFSRVFSRILTPKDAGVLNAMVLGEKSGLLEEVRELYRKAGIAHILAISGLHISILGMGVFRILRRIGIPLWIASSLTAGLVVCYGVMTGFGVSTRRAVLMLLLSLIARLCGRTYDMISAACLAALWILWEEPMQLFQSGFLLSFGAVAAIGFLYPVLKEWNVPGIKKYWRDAVVLNLAISLVTLPVLLFFYYEFPIYSLFLNLLVLPLVSFLFLLAISGALAGLWFLPAANFLLGSVSVILWVYESACRGFLKLPGSVRITGKPSPLQIFFYYGLLLIAFLGGKRGRKKERRPLFALFVPAGLVCLLVTLPARTLKTTFLDVGQGDGIVMKAPSGAVILVDGGSVDVKEVGKYRLEPFLKASGIQRVDYAVATHGDMDHISGLLELLEHEEIPVEHLVLSWGAPSDPNYERLKRAAGGRTKLLRMKKGDRLWAGGVVLHCLHPSPEFSGETRNAYSLVLSVEWKRFSMLLTGDLEAEQEELLDEGLLTGYDVLKAAHHGSEYSTSEPFLHKVRPKLTVISCGRGNAFGHPHRKLLQRLEESGSRIRITAETGAVAVETDGNKFWITNFKKQV